MHTANGLDANTARFMCTPGTGCMRFMYKLMGEATSSNYNDLAVLFFFSLSLDFFFISKLCVWQAVRILIIIYYPTKIVNDARDSSQLDILFLVYLFVTFS